MATGSTTIYERKQKEPALVVALDIGSTHSGYAFQFRDDFRANPQSGIEFNTSWGQGSIAMYKTPTCILLKRVNQDRICEQNPKDEDFETLYFGFPAEDKFCRLYDKHRRVMKRKARKQKRQEQSENNGDEDADETDSSEDDSEDEDVELYERCYLFKRSIKMYLYGQTDTSKFQAEDENGQHLPLSYVMYKFISAMKNHFMDKRLTDRGSKLSEEDIRWVVTVPAIWSDSAKGLMRAAATRSGMKNLLIALEPEVAAVHCIHLSKQEKDFLGGLGKVGDQFLVVDFGGGTADITAVEVSGDGRLKALIPDTGGPWGAQNINEAFFQKCRDVFPDPVWSEMAGMERSELLEMENDFENLKVQIGEGNYEEKRLISLRVPRCIQEKLKPKGKKKTQLRETAKGFINTDRNKFEIEPEGVKQLFKETVDLIIGRMREIMSQKKLEGIKRIVLVGGFAESTILKASLEEVFGKEGKQIFVPSQPLYAVLKGAVIFGQNPDIFKSRISKLSYGTDVRVPFDEKVHPIEKRVVDEDGGYRCKDVFDVHVSKDEIVSTESSVKTITYYPSFANQTSMGINIYSSKSLAPNFVTDEGCKLVSKWSIEIPDTTKGRDREVEVKMIYGGTELVVKAFDKSTGKEFQTKVNFR